ncbi:UNVERIFIED_ORG: beta-ketoacyl synthase [Lacrimispora saccharolytica]|nr:hypothetical protein CLOM621_07559 [Clostridium sp. M62/1]CBK76968.1 hypothetical protein CLS_13250 [[Clostridium] cf. saccharolyticum K10]CBL36879.1 hypothetical protein CL3_29890 [butyrate-producing bacterium SM4/1]
MPLLSFACSQHFMLSGTEKPGFSAGLSLYACPGAVRHSLTAEFPPMTSRLCLAAVSDSRQKFRQPAAYRAAKAVVIMAQKKTFSI